MARSSAPWRDKPSISKLWDALVSVVFVPVRVRTSIAPSNQDVSEVPLCADAEPLPRRVVIIDIDTMTAYVASNILSSAANIIVDGLYITDWYIYWS